MLRKVNNVHQWSTDKMKGIFDHMQWDVIITGGQNLLQISSSSSVLVGLKVIGVLLFSGRNERKE